MLKENERLDDLMCNNYHIIQNPNEYCFTSDATKLGNFVKSKRDDKVVDLCAGSGIVGIVVHLNNKSHITFVELQEHMADMCERTIALNKFDKMKVVNAKLQGIHKVIGLEEYDVVVCNPPYGRANKNDLLNEKESIAICRHQITVTIDEIIEEASKLLRFGGSLYLVNKEAELVNLITLCKKYNLETKEIVVNTNNGKGNGTIFIKATKGGKSGVKINFNTL